MKNILPGYSFRSLYSGFDLISDAALDNITAQTIKVQTISQDIFLESLQDSVIDLTKLANGEFHFANTFLFLNLNLV